MKKKGGHHSQIETQISIKQYTFSQKVWRIILLASVSTFFFQFFVLPSGIVVQGIEGTLQGISNSITIGTSDLNTTTNEITSSVNSEFIYWILYSLYGTIIILWSFKYIGKEYSFLTAIYMLSSALTGFILTFFTYLTNFSILPEWNQMISESIIWASILDTAGYGDFTQHFLVKTLMFLAITVSVIIGCIPIAIMVSQVYILGGGADGFDPIGYYISKKNGRNFGQILTFYTFINLAIFSILNYYILYNLSYSEYAYTNMSPMPGWQFDNFLILVFGPQFVGSLIYIIILSSIIDYRFPRNRKLSLYVYSKETNRIRYEFLKTDINHPFTILKIHGGYSLKTEYALNFVINYRELDLVLTFIEKIDPNAFITVNNVYEVYTKKWNNRIHEYIEINPKHKDSEWKYFDAFSNETFNSIEERNVQEAYITNQLLNLNDYLNSNLKDEATKIIEKHEYKAKNTGQKIKFNQEDYTVEVDKKVEKK